MKPAKAVIIGVGSERGLGAALSRCFAAHQRHVFVVGRTAAKLEKVAEAITWRGHSAIAFAADATQEDEVIRLLDAPTVQ